MKNVLIIVTTFAATGLLTACAGDIERFKQNYSGVKGKRVSALVNAIGTPDTETVVMGQKVYSWKNQIYGSTIKPVTQNTTFSGPGGTIFGSGTSYVSDDYDLSCVYKVVVDHKGIINEADYSGAPGACAKYGQRLELLVNPAAAAIKP